ncbi:hypothetical protein Tco_0812556 [Tanacetum coccineum]
MRSCRTPYPNIVNRRLVKVLCNESKRKLVVIKKREGEVPSVAAAVLKEEIASPVELAKAYMGSRPSKVALRQDLVLHNNATGFLKSPNTLIAPKIENGFTTPRSQESFLLILLKSILDINKHGIRAMVARLQEVDSTLIRKIKRHQGYAGNGRVSVCTIRTNGKLQIATDFNPLLKKKRNTNRLKEQTYHEEYQGLCEGKNLHFEVKKRATTQRRSLERRPRTTWPGWKDTVNKKGSRDDCGYESKLTQTDEEAVKESEKEYIGMVKICYEGAQRSKQERPGEDVVGNSKWNSKEEKQDCKRFGVSLEGNMEETTEKNKRRTRRTRLKQLGGNLVSELETTPGLLATIVHDQNQREVADSNRLQSTLEEEEEHESIEGTNRIWKRCGSEIKNNTQGKKKTLAIPRPTNSEKENKPITCFEGNTDGYLEFVVEHGVEQKKENIEVYCGTTFWKRTTTTTTEKKELVWFVNRIEVDKKGRERVERREDSKNKT